MTRRQRAIAIFAIFAAAAGIAAGLIFGLDQAEEATALKPGSPEVVRAGHRIYAQHCAACHGINLEGQPNWRQRRPDGMLPAPPHDPTGHTWHHPDEQLVALTKFGPQRVAGADYQSEMPAYEGQLTDAEIVAVLSYIKSTWPAEIRERHDQINARAAQR